MLGIGHLAPGVWGYTIEANHSLYVPVIISQDEGRGYVAAYLDRLPMNKRIVFPTVLNPKLVLMLLKRGFLSGYEYSTDFGEWVEIWHRTPALPRRR